MTHGLSRDYRQHTLLVDRLFSSQNTVTENKSTLAPLHATRAKYCETMMSTQPFLSPRSTLPAANAVRLLDAFAWQVRPMNDFPVLGAFEDLTAEMHFGYDFTGEWQDESKYLVTRLSQASDCVTPISSNLFQLVETWNGVQEYFVNIQIDLNERELASEYEVVNEAIGVAEFCVRVDYMNRLATSRSNIMAFDDHVESINFHETIVRLTFNWWVPPDPLETDTTEIAAPRLENVAVEIKEPSSSLQDDEMDQLTNTTTENLCHFEGGLVGNFRKQSCRLNNLSADTQAVAMALVPKVTATLSGLSSLLLMIHASQRNNDNVKKKLGANKGMLIGGCMSHFVAALAWFATTWPIPSSTDDQDNGDEWFWNIGSESSCRVQGFLAQWSIATTVYTLGALVLLAIPELGKRLQNVVHVSAWALAFGAGGIAGTLNLFHPLEWMCWIGPSIQDCNASEDSVCEHDRVYRYLLRDGLVWLCLLFSTGVMVRMHCFQRIHTASVPDTTVERGRIPRDGSTSSLGCTISLAQEKHSSRSMQGIFLSVFVCWVPFLTIQLYQDISGVMANFWLRLIAVALLPCQGLWVLMMFGIKSVARTIWESKTIPVTVVVGKASGAAQKEGQLAEQKNDKANVFPRIEWGDEEDGGESAGSLEQTHTEPAEMLRKDDGGVKSSSTEALEHSG